jgi:hypothetical protein
LRSDQAQTYLLAVAVFRGVLRTIAGLRNFCHLQVAAAADFLGNILRDVSRPAFGGIEADDAHRVFTLYVQQVGDNVL